jgi:hypothetical protein
MRTPLVLVLIGLLLVGMSAGCSPDSKVAPQSAPTPDTASADSGSNLLAHLWQVFGDYNAFEIELGRAIEDITPDKLIPLLGMARCARLVVFLWGLYALTAVRKLLRRIL